ncbi:enoyl-CoA hydratase/isomerase family protein [Taibaiella helva]|uniref:enoyl-CoA hydratase/isomerase family protein n=1 Tax=Taibaiella helva TaxID=2301235 RepID=UPI000E594BA6|nr:enoyl-CoA hydratase/isomerase family protein [Taibaiella helva]
MMSNHPEGYVHTSIENGIGKIEFYHPASNSLPGAILTDLAHAINDVGTDDRAKVIVLQSGGERSFCAGASFDELLAISNETEGKTFFNGFALVINAMRKCHKFIIARVQGKAVGGGVGIISAADYAIAVESASIKLSELAVGIGPFVVGPAVQRKIGVAGFSQLAIDATEWRSADWARKHGLYSEIHADIPSVNEAVAALATKLAHSNPEAMTQLKKIFWEGTENWDELLTKRAAISGKLVLSEFSHNAIHSFKRKS